MQLVNFSATNYRSITAAHRIAFSNVTVLIGKNNEGKSNLLRALEAAMLLLQRHANTEPGRYRAVAGETPYLWRRDFPIQLQDRRSVNQTILKLDFLLDAAECIEFKQEIGSSLNGSLPLEIKIGKDEAPIIRLIKSGKGAKGLSAC
jgi:putative ATP-dependent endonuclease of the OLD family